MAAQLPSTDKTVSGDSAQDMNDSITGSYMYVSVTVTYAQTDWAAIREFKVYGY